MEDDWCAVAHQLIEVCNAFGVLRTPV